jgi:hypothetical protein
LERGVNIPAVIRLLRRQSGLLGNPDTEQLAALLATRVVRLELLDEIEREAKTVLEQFRGRKTVLARKTRSGFVIKSEASLNKLQKPLERVLLLQSPTLLV